MARVLPGQQCPVKHIQNRRKEKKHKNHRTRRTVDGTQQSRKFTVLIAALDKTKAHEIAASYFLDSHMSAESITVEKFKDANTKFDCDYILR